jgi:hypothetical protein
MSPFSAWSRMKWYHIWMDSRWATVIKCLLKIYTLLFFLYTCAIHLALFRTICPFSSNLFLNIHFIPMIILSLDLDTSFHTLFLLNLVSFFLYSTNSMWINISFFKKKLGSTYDTNTYWVIFWFRSDLVITHSLELPITLDKWWEDTSLRTLGM